MSPSWEEEFEVYQEQEFIAEVMAEYLDYIDEVTTATTHLL